MSICPGIQSHTVNALFSRLLQPFDESALRIGLVKHQIHLTSPLSEQFIRQGDYVVHALRAVNFRLTLSKVPEVGAVENQNTIRHAAPNHAEKDCSKSIRVITS